MADRVFRKLHFPFSLNDRSLGIRMFAWAVIIVTSKSSWTKYVNETIAGLVESKT